MCLVLPLLFAQGTKDKPDPAAGKAVFEARCEMCHEAESDESKTGPGLKGVKNGKLPSGMKATRENILELVDDGREVIDTEKRTGRIMQVGSQRVSSVVYQKAKELLERGAIGELNMVEAWVDRNSAIGAWQYSIPPDASPQIGRASCRERV